MKVEEEEGDQDEEWLDLSMVEEMMDEVEFNIEPEEGEKLELKNEKRIYKAEMSLNKKLMAEANK